MSPPLHGRIVFTDHRANDRERHFCFRALQHANAVAFSARLRAAHTAAGIAAKIDGRKLILIRRGPPPSGPKTNALFREFEAAGGTVIDPSDDDLRTFLALRRMRDEAMAEGTFETFRCWLEANQPLYKTKFFSEASLVPPPVPNDDAPGGKEVRASTPPVGTPPQKFVEPKALDTNPEGAQPPLDMSVHKDDAQPLAILRRRGFFLIHSRSFRWVLSLAGFWQLTLLLALPSFIIRHG